MAYLKSQLPGVSILTNCHNLRHVLCNLKWNIIKNNYPQLDFYQHVTQPVYFSEKLVLLSSAIGGNNDGVRNEGQHEAYREF